jgi:peptide/nickel transport system substrate-binding protein
MRRAVFWAFFVAAAAVLAHGCGRGKPEPADERLADTDVLVWGGVEPKSLDPAKAHDGESLIVCDNFYDGLVTFADDGVTVAPALAERWDISDDGLQYTFRLRQGVTFHDGTPFNADAVVSHFGRRPAEAPPFSGVVGRVEALDGGTVRFTLTQPSGLFLKYLSMRFAYIPSPTAVHKYGEQYGGPASIPAGTGPFKFHAWDKGVRIVLDANANYWGEKPRLKRVICRSFENPAARLLALERGEIDGMQLPDLDVLQRMQQDPNITQIRQPALNVAYLAMDCREKPFDDVRVRQAVCHAIDKQQLVETLYGGLGRVAVNPIPPEVPGYDNDVEDYPCDPQQARQLLAAAGYPDGFDADLWYVSDPLPSLINAKEAALMIQSDLRQVGIRATLKSADRDAFLDEVGNDTHAMALFGWSAELPDADGFFGPLLSIPASQPPHAQNIAFYRSDPLQRLIEQARGETNQYQRLKLYRQACRLVHDDAPWVPLVHTSRVVLVRSNVHGIAVPLDGRIVFNAASKD